MICSFCNHDFAESEASTGGCKSCVSDSSGCGMLKCPKCGYDNPQEIKWVKDAVELVSKKGKAWGKFLLNLRRNKLER